MIIVNIFIIISFFYLLSLFFLIPFGIMFFQTLIDKRLRGNMINVNVFMANFKTIKTIECYAH